ncbi:apolipoprotein N-acyltransferase [Wenyingzhuangia aestuarii]|nr:apolipoprotein N-acyltransferase [Wenyingzhuangia aestuarii]
MAILFLFFSCSFSGVYFSLLFWISQFTWFNNSTSQCYCFINRITIAAIWVLGEFILALVLKGFPFHSYRIGFPLCENIYLIQLAPIGGLSLLTFVVILTNILFADFLLLKTKISLLKGITIPFICFAISFITYKSYQPQNIKQPFKVASVSANTDPNTNWSQAKVNQMAKDYFSISREAIKSSPDFIIWPESTIPWTYSEKDDLLNEILKISKNTNTTNVLGILTTANQKEVYNSAYYFKQEKITGKYHKETPVKGTEVPFLGFLLPMANGNEFTVKKALTNHIINTPFGNAGTLICNESTIEQAALKQIKTNNVHFFFNLSNDGWFKDSYVAKHHFYYNRLLAVEYRKDMAISNNCGYNAIIKSNGNIPQYTQRNKPTVIHGTLQANSNKTLMSKHPLGFIYLLIALLIINYSIHFKFLQL